MSILTLALAKKYAEGLVSGSRIVGLGDSITIGNVDLTNQAFGDTSWFQQFIVRSKGNVRYVYNAGIGGQRSDQILARIQTDVISKNPDICVILAGTNDVGQTIPIATTRANIEQMILILLNNGIMPVLGTIPPRNDTSFHIATSKVNLTIFDLANKYKLPLIDFFSALVDVTTNKFITEFTTDGVHPNGLGSKAMAVKALNVLAPYISGFRQFLPSSNIEPSNILSNGLFLNDANADGVPDAWGIFGSGTNITPSLVSDSSIMGNWAQLNAAAGNSGAKFLQANTLTTGFAVGDKLALVGKINAVAEAGSMPYSVFISCNGASVTLKPINSWTTDLDGLIYFEFTVPSGTTGFNIQVYVNNNVGTLKIAQMGLINLTTLGLSQY